MESFLERVIVATAASLVAGLLVKFFTEKAQFGRKLYILLIVTAVLTTGLLTAIYSERVLGTKSNELLHANEQAGTPINPSPPAEPQGEKGGQFGSGSSRPPPPTQTVAAAPREPGPAAGEQSPEQVVSEEDEFVQKYLAKDVGSGGSAPRWAILIAGREATSYLQLNSAVADVLSEKGYQRVSVFRRSLLQDARYEVLYAADPFLIRRLREYCDGIIVGTVHSALRRDATAEGLLTAELSLNVRVIATATGGIRNEFSICENGAGFSSAQAQAHAEERLARSLEAKLQVAVP